MNRQTKIVATLGPASSSPEVLERMIRAGVDVVRLNFSHGKAQDHIDRAAMVREVARRVGKAVAVMADLQGPKIRVGKFEGGKTELTPGQRFVLDGGTTELGTNDRVGLDYVSCSPYRVPVARLAAAQATLAAKTGQKANKES